MEWLLVAVLAKGIVATDLTFDEASECYAVAADAAVMSRDVMATYNGTAAEGLAPTQYSCVLMDD